MTESPKLLALEKVAEAWTGAGLKWAVCNGLESYPEGIGRDLDVVVEKGCVRGALEIAVGELDKLSWVVLPNRQGWIWWVVAFREKDEGGFESLQIDLFDHLQWAFTWVVDGVGTDASLIKRGPFLEDPGASVGKTFVLNGLSGGMKAFSKKKHYLDLSSAEFEALPELLERISGRKWPDLIKSLRDRNWGELESELQALRKACRWRPLGLGRLPSRVFSAIQKQWSVNWRPMQGAPVIFLEPGVARREKILATICDEVETLVYQDHKVVTDSSLSPRQLRRRSCLQVVLIFDGTEPTSGLEANFRITSEGNSQDARTILVSSGDSDERFCGDLRTSFASYFQKRSEYLRHYHSIR